MTASDGQSSTPALLPAHVPVLDGIRGTAILLVMFFHFTHIGFVDPASLASAPILDRALVWAARSGWMGVDLFFVLSGFLITGILLDSKARRLNPARAHAAERAAATPLAAAGRDADRVDRAARTDRGDESGGGGGRGEGGRGFFLTFYARRTLRIFPLYYAVLGLFLVLVPMLVALPSPPVPGIVVNEAREYAALAPHQAWFWLYGANFFTALHGWAGKSIDVLWSLAIEEQFYLVWPALVWFLSRRGLQILCAAIIFGAIALRFTLLKLGYSWTTVYVLTPCRLDALAAGALVALAIRGSLGVAGVRRACVPFAIAAGAGLLTILLRDQRLREYDPAMQVVGYSCLAVVFACALARSLPLTPPLASAASRALSSTSDADASAPGLLARAFLLRPLRALGTYAYALYLFHVPVKSVMAAVAWKPHRVPGVLSLYGSQIVMQLIFYVLCFAVTLVAAMLSWRFFEKPILSLKSRFE